jgi:outer membrane protein insertion porin family
VGYKLEKVDFNLNNSVTFLTPPSALVLAQVGTHTTSSLNFSVTQDMRDNKFAPTTGHKMDFSTILAGGPLGGGENFYKLTTGASKYYPLPFEFVFMAHGAIKYGGGFGGSDLPLFENFMLNGQELRGFTYQNVGPMDSSLNSIGGDSALLLNLEISYNFTKAVEGVWFYDRGQVYGIQGDLSRTTSNRFDPVSMRHSVGFGLRFTTPAMPIWVSWGFKLDKRPEETPMEFLFTLGGAF